MKTIKFALLICAGFFVIAVYWITLVYITNPPIHYRYTRQEIHHILVWSNQNDTLQSAIEHWYIIQENPENSTQKEVDSIEAIIETFHLKEKDTLPRWQ